MTEINPEKILNKNPQKLEEKRLKAVFKKNSSIDEIIDIIKNEKDKSWNKKLVEDFIYVVKNEQLQ